MLSHLEEKAVGHYRSYQTIEKRYATFCRKNSKNFDNALQIKLTFWWITDLLTLKKVIGNSEKILSGMVTLLEYCKENPLKIRNVAFFK